MPFLAFATAALPMAAETSETEERTFEVGAHSHVNVESVHGDVSIRPGKEGTITFTITRTLKTDDEKAAAASFQAWPAEFTQDGDSVTLTVSGPEKKGWFSGAPKSPGIRIDVLVPADATVTIHTVSGDIDLQSVNGDHRLESTSGDFELVSIRGDLELQSVSGDIEASEISGRITCATASGDLEMAGLSGSLSAETASGDIEVLASDLTAQLSTASGDIELAVAGLTGDLEAESASGDIEIDLGSGNHATVSLESRSGDVSSSLPLTDETRTNKGRQIHGVLGEGTHQVALKSISGDVSLDQSRD